MLKDRYVWVVLTDSRNREGRNFGMNMNSSHYYRQFEQAGTGDPDEIDDGYLIWCAFT